MKNVTNVIPNTKPIIKTAGILKGDGQGGVSAAVPGVDYLDQSVAPSIGTNGNWFVGTEDTGIPAKAQSNTTIATITLLASGWVDNQQATACIGVSADEAKQNINISPALAQEDIYQDAGVTCVGFAEDMLAFATESIPAEDLTVYVAIEQTDGSGVASNVYSTEETVVGTWIDGKPLYRRTILASITSATTDSDASLLSISGVHLCHAFGVAKAKSWNGEYAIPYCSYWGSNYYIFMLRYEGNAFKLQHKWDGPRSFDIEAVFEYTKDADTAAVSTTSLMDTYEEGVENA